MGVGRGPSLFMATNMGGTVTFHDTELANFACLYILVVIRWKMHTFLHPPHAG